MSLEPSINKTRSWTVLDHENDTDLKQHLEASQLSALTDFPRCNMNFCFWEVPNLDKNTSNKQDIDVEYERLKVLRSYGILETPRDPRFERITALASRIFSVPIALVSFVDMGRQWFLSNRGLGDVRETPRDVAFCAHAILSKEDLFIVNDTMEDERFCNNGLVTGDPHIRFYAGAPLICPEGFKLGTLCIIDFTPRPEGLSLMEKQNLRELSAFVVDTLVQRREEIKQANEDKYKIIACTAHDLLTPLFGIELNLSLLMDDGKLWRGMNNHQKELVQSACSCTEMMSRICHDAIDTYRGTLKKESSSRNVMSSTSDNSNNNSAERTRPGQVVTISRLVKNLKTTIDSYPKRVPIFFELAKDVPPVILSDDVKLFRSALNYLTNACKVTEDGSITFRIFVETIDYNSEKSSNSMSASLVFEVDDSGPGININDYPGLFLAFRANNLHQKQSPVTNTPKSIGLGLSSVAGNISSLGGDYGFTTKNKNGEKMRRCHSGASFNSLLSQGSNDQSKSGSIFWFSTPIVVPPSTTEEEKKKSVMKEDVLQALDNLSKSFVNESSGHVPNTIQIDMSPIRDTPMRSIGESLSAIAEATEPQVNFSCTLSRKKTSATAAQRHCLNKNNRRTSVDMPIGNNTPNFVSKNEDVANSRKRKALIIDDSLTIRKSIDRALKNSGFDVTQAENGMIGLQCLKMKPFDVVFCDFLMPIMDGLDCVKQFRTWENYHRPGSRQYIIGISAHASPNDANCGLSGGMDMFLSKPLKLKTIKELVVSEHVSAQSKRLDEEFSKISLEKRAADSSLTSTCSSIDSHQDGDNPRINDESSNLVDETNSEVINHVTGPVCLIAEDSKVVGKSLVYAIEKRGYRTSLVENGEDALRLLKMRNWDIVFLDDQMPLLSGSSCIARFRTWELRNRVVRQNNVYLLSGNIGDNGVDSNYTTPAGFDGAFGKPFKMQTLYKLLESEEVRAQCDPQEILLRY